MTLIEIMQLPEPERSVQLKEAYRPAREFCEELAGKKPYWNQDDEDECVVELEIVRTAL